MTAHGTEGKEVSDMSTPIASSLNYAPSFECRHLFPIWYFVRLSSPGPELSRRKKGLKWSVFAQVEKDD